MKNDKVIALLTTLPPAEAANDAVKMYKRYLVTKTSIWIGTLFLATLVQRLATDALKSNTE